MKRLVCLLSVLFAACGVAPSWNGDPAACDYIYRGACVKGVEQADVERGFEYAEIVFGPVNADGYLIHAVPVITNCGPGGESVLDGCDSNTNKEIQIRLDSEWCPAWLITHELGHVILPYDPHHDDDRWSKLVNGGCYYEICQIPYPFTTCR